MTDMNDAPMADAGSDMPGGEGASPSDLSQAEPTPRAAIDRAFDSLGVERTDGGDHAEHETHERGEETLTDEDARENSGDERESTELSLEEPPARFSADAKAAWAYAPPAIKAEIHRAVREMEAGIEKHRDAAQHWESLRDYDHLAQSFGTDIQGALDRYIAADMKLNDDLIGGLEEIVSHYGYSLHDIAAHLAGQAPDATRAQTEAQNRALKQELQMLRAELGGMSSAMTQQRLSETASSVHGFATQRPGFDQLAEEISFFIESGRAADLSEAYELAERLQGHSSAHRAQGGRRFAQHQGLSAQTRKGALSVTGAPSSGSNPYNRKPPSSAREALDRAFANSGLG